MRGGSQLYQTEYNKMEYASTEFFCAVNSTGGCGNGVCNSDGSWCTCEAGYEHDYSIMMFPNCYISSLGRMISISLFIVVFLILIPLSIYRMKGSISLARRLYDCAIVMSVSESVALIAFHLEGGQGIVYNFAFSTTNFATTGCAMSVILWTYLSPIVALMRKKELERRILRRLYVYLFVTFCTEYGRFMMFVIYLQDFRARNIIFMASTMISLMNGIVMQIVLYRISTMLFHQLDTISVTLHDNRLQKYKQDLNTLLSYMRQVNVQSVIFMGALASLYFILGVFPYAFVIFVFVHLTFLSFIVAILFFLSLRKTQPNQVSSNVSSTL